MQDISELIEKFLTRTISSQERKILKKWVLQKQENLAFFKKEIRKRSENTLYHHFDENEAFNSFLQTIKKHENRKNRFSGLLRYAAIFVGLLSIGYGAYHFLNPSEPENNIVTTEKQQQTPQTNVVISLADGSQQVIHQDGQVVLKDKDGKTIAKKEEQGLDFRQSKGSTSQNLVFNEVYVPHGQTFSITLSDGTKVWLNAGTRLRFPQNLKATSQNRMVYLDGEAYFDVTKDEKRPFIVNAQNIDIKVLGTQFNVSAYSSDNNIATTLVEGSVNVYENSNPDTKILLSPSYQADFTKENGAFTQKKVDTSIYTSWMQNKLVIDHLSFKEIIKKLERSHNVTIINTAEYLNDEIFNGEFDNEGIDVILNTIASSTPFTYTIQNNVITISK